MANQSLLLFDLQTLKNETLLEICVGKCVWIQVLFGCENFILSWSLLQYINYHVLDFASIKLHVQPGLSLFEFGPLV